MNNKGFTLIELLIVISIIGVIATLATVSLNTSLEATKRVECDNYINAIEEAACTYASIHNICYDNVCEDIKINTLISEGYIKNNINKCNNKEFKDSDIVKVTLSDMGERICKYIGE